MFSDDNGPAYLLALGGAFLILLYIFLLPNRQPVVYVMATPVVVATP